MKVIIGDYIKMTFLFRTAITAPGTGAPLGLHRTLNSFCFWSQFISWPLLALGAPKVIFHVPLEPSAWSLLNEWPVQVAPRICWAPFRQCRDHSCSPPRVLGSLGLVGVIKFPSEHTNSHSNAVLLQISLHV